LGETLAPMTSTDADSDAPDENWQKVEPGEGSDGDGTPRAVNPAVNGHASVVQGSAPPGNGLDAGRMEELVEEGRSAGREALEPSKGVDDPKAGRKDRDLEREWERDNKDKEKEKDREREREDRGKKRDREQEKRDREPERRRDKEKEERGREKTREKQRKGRDRCSSSGSASARSSSPKKGKRKPQQPSKAKDRKARRDASSSSAASSERKKPRRRNTGRRGVDDVDL